MFNPSDGNTQQLDPTLENVIGYTFGSANVPERILQRADLFDGPMRGAFDPSWQLRGLKVVNLYAQRSRDPTQMNPNDTGELRNTVSDKITQCQNDRRCKAIVAAWGTIPSKAYGDSQSERAANKRLITQRKKEIANEINATGKGGYIGDTTAANHPRHPLTQAGKTHNRRGEVKRANPPPNGKDAQYNENTLIYPPPESDEE